MYTHVVLRRELRFFQSSCTANCTTEIIHYVLTAEYLSVVHRPWEGSSLRCTNRAPAALHHSYPNQWCGSEIIYINVWNMAHFKSCHTLWYNIRSALNNLHRWHTGKRKLIQLMKQCMEEHLFWKLPTQTLAVLLAKHTVTIPRMLSSPQPSSLSLGKLEETGCAKIAQHAFKNNPNSQDSNPYSCVGGKERSFLLIYSTHIRKKVQKLTKWIDVFVCMWLSTEGTVMDKEQCNPLGMRCWLKMNSMGIAGDSYSISDEPTSDWWPHVSVTHF